MITSQQRLLIPTLMATLLFTASFSYAAQEIRFSWAILTDTEKGMTALDFTSTPKVEKNDTLQLYLLSDQKTYIYVFLLDSSNYFFPIFPIITKYYDHHPPGGLIRIPEGENRFTTEPPAGQEKFYLIATPERLVTVEKLLDKCLDHPNDIDLQANLFKEIRALRRQHSKMTQFTEKGMPIGGGGPAGVISPTRV